MGAFGAIKFRPSEKAVDYPVLAREWTDNDQGFNYQNRHLMKVMHWNLVSTSNIYHEKLNKKAPAI